MAVSIGIWLGIQYHPEFWRDLLWELDFAQQWKVLGSGGLEGNGRISGARNQLTPEPKHTQVPSFLLLPDPYEGGTTKKQLGNKLLSPWFHSQTSRNGS